MRLVCLRDHCPKPCCRLVGPPQLTLAEAAVLDPDVVRHEAGEILVREAKCGGCVLSKNGACAIYQGRPQACADYPWYNLDGELYYDAGCPGLHFDADDRPSITEIRPFEFYLKSLRPTLLAVVLFWLRRLPGPSVPRTGAWRLFDIVARRNARRPGTSGMAVCPPAKSRIALPRKRMAQRNSYTG